MVEEIEAVKALLHSQEYSGLAEKVIRRTKKKLCTDLYDAEAAHCQKALGTANLSLLSFSSLLRQYTAEQLEEFRVRLVRAEKSLDVGQDFNPLEPDEKEEENETYVGHSRTFLLTFAVMYILLRDRRSEFGPYLKAMRQPKAAKYQRGVESVFDSL